MTDHDDTPIEPDWLRTGEMPAVRPPRQRFERTRSHRVVQPVAPRPALYDQLAPTHGDADPDGWRPGEWSAADDVHDWHVDAWDVDPWDEPVIPDRHRVGVDPRLLRIGALAAAGALMIPLALALREDDGGELRADAEEVRSAVTVQTPTTTIADAVTLVPITAAVAAPLPTPATRSAGAGSSSDSAAASGGGAAASGGGAGNQPAAAPEPPRCAGTYTVVSNDYWTRFPSSSGSSVEDWLEANDATLETPLFVGDELCIPEGATAPSPPPTTTEPPATTAAATTAPPATEPPATTAVATTAAPTTAPATTRPSSTTRPPATTAAPATTAPPTTRPPAPGPAPSPTDPAGVEALIRQIWPDDLEERALTIARRESGLRPDAYNGHCCYGLFQIYFTVNRSFLATLGITSSDQLLDARTNTTAAYAMYQRSGWAPWSQTDPGP